MVQEICRDIKKLDFAKKNITTTITALHRLTMLVSAVEQLQVMASKRQYKEAAAQLEVHDNSSIKMKFPSSSYAYDNNSIQTKLPTPRLNCGVTNDTDHRSERLLSHVPNEASLSGVEPIMQKIHGEIRRVDATILSAVRQQSNSGTKAKEDLADATRAVEDLSYKIREIKSKAEQSETMVQEICRDIKKLDFAKKNITTTITALHRLTMLVSAVEQLQVMASKRQYKEAAAQLEAVSQLCNHFEAYRDVPKISELRQKLYNIKQILKSHVFSDFSSLGTGKETEETNLLQHLSDCCLVVDALESSVREEVVNNFCSRELTSYEQIFEGAELARLDKTERRYAWIKRRIRTNEEIWKIFPASWHVPYRLCIQFCKKTRYYLLSFR
ncbi:hypothetical protein F2Q68_00006725 [Brassica cretica]|uniref:Vps53 N-terminal domain-containing protein n=1 Tax=Brassica cretica TaxID=69181 RepID=A0A8S9JIX7_BRACR|nr:hypothetical protein F2Q68_00006725 [Brassica cretica]